MPTFRMCPDHREDSDREGEVRKEGRKSKSRVVFRKLKKKVGLLGSSSGDYGLADLGWDPRTCVFERSRHDADALPSLGTTDRKQIT